MTPAQLKERRKGLGMSQNELAQALRVHKLTVAAWEQGRQAIPPYLDLALQTLEREKRGEK